MDAEPWSDVCRKAGYITFADAFAALESRVAELEKAYGLLWSFDISPVFDAHGRYTTEKAYEWKALLDRANAIYPRPPEAALRSADKEQNAKKAEPGRPMKMN